MKQKTSSMDRHTRKRIEKAYLSERPRFLKRLRSLGRTLEEAEDLIHDVYADVLENISPAVCILNLPACLNTMLRRRIIDTWRHSRMRAAKGETEVSEEVLREVISGAGLNPLDTYVQSKLVDALNSALHVLPDSQRQVLEAQVFGGMTFSEISKKTGVNIETLKARKKYAVRKLSVVLRHWMDE
ncbi:MAG: hypothetical protein B0D92_08330 [Spirochaeta sp. LUC14_002_19_P3]|nr:MAG: hypothetical protein B0D92_08330 [Spirochaeta sp. LUC14_002_19_P3]